MQLDWISPPVLDCKSPHSRAATTHSNRAAVFHLSYLVAERVVYRAPLMPQHFGEAILGRGAGEGQSRIFGKSKSAQGLTKTRQR